MSPASSRLVIEYADDGLPGALWSESGNVMTVERDAVGRVANVADLTGEALVGRAWDDNGNPTAIDVPPSGRDGRTRLVA